MERKRGNLMKKYISKKMKNQSITIIPGVCWSTIYQITIDRTMAIAVPTTLPINPKIDCPEVIDMPMAFFKSDDVYYTTDQHPSRLKRIGKQKNATHDNNHCPH